MSLNLKSSGGGSVTIDVPSTATNYTATLPAVTATIATNANGDLYPLTSGTAQATTSGTSIDFTSIPSWVKRITVMFNGTSLSGTSEYLIQIGAGSVTTSGYVSSGVAAQSTAVSGTAFTSTAGFLASAGIANAALLMNGAIQIFNISGNAWVSSGTTMSTTGSRGSITSGTVTLSGTLDRVRITTVNGTDTFDAGSINILYE